MHPQPAQRKVAHLWQGERALRTIAPLKPAQFRETWKCLPLNGELYNVLGIAVAVLVVVMLGTCFSVCVSIVLKNGVLNGPVIQACTFLGM